MARRWDEATGYEGARRLPLVVREARAHQVQDGDGVLPAVERCDDGVWAV